MHSVLKQKQYPAVALAVATSGCTGNNDKIKNYTGQAHYLI